MGEIGNRRRRHAWLRGRRRPCAAPGPPHRLALISARPPFSLLPSPSLPSPPLGRPLSPSPWLCRSALLPAAISHKSACLSLPPSQACPSLADVLGRPSLPRV
ncbi:hypothetical protein BD311DRAFT_266214 [Dichomitus squalens]|uniref:Uncharacterized protein n=1 Tax=Dichomitus squalens TaxID=114155 RepID=A0A4Q9MSP3_9APHY|nr:hypothetical protein BD311DRAFT_266214 [Dichomitus squalens]